MTEQEKQERMDAVRDFLERNDGRPLILVGAALADDGTLVGCRMPHGFNDIDTAVKLFGGMFLATIDSGVSQDTKIKLLAASAGEALKMLGSEAEAGNEID